MTGRMLCMSISMVKWPRDGAAGTYRVDMQVDLWAHDLVPPVDAMDQIPRIESFGPVKTACTAKGVSE